MKKAKKRAKSKSLSKRRVKSKKSSNACRRQVEDSQTDKVQAADEIEKIQPS